MSTKNKPQPNPDVEQAWIKEARRRLKRYKNGEVEGISGEKVHRELTDKYLK